MIDRLVKQDVSATTVSFVVKFLLLFGVSRWGHLRIPVEDLLQHNFLCSISITSESLLIRADASRDVLRELLREMPEMPPDNKIGNRSRRFHCLFIP